MTASCAARQGLAPWAVLHGHEKGWTTFRYFLTTQTRRAPPGPECRP